MLPTSTLHPSHSFNNSKLTAAYLGELDESSFLPSPLSSPVKDQTTHSMSLPVSAPIGKAKATNANTTATKNANAAAGTMPLGIPAAGLSTHEFLKARMREAE